MKPFQECRLQIVGSARHRARPLIIAGGLLLCLVALTFDSGSGVLLANPIRDP